jgi:hypothetical protein
MVFSTQSMQSGYKEDNWADFDFDPVSWELWQTEWSSAWEAGKAECERAKLNSLHC